MKHLFIYILCSILCCGAYAQTNVKSPSPGVKLRTMKTEKAMRSGKLGKDGVFKHRQETSEAAPQTKTKNEQLRNRTGNPIEASTPIQRSKRAVKGDEARITLYVQSDWSDGSGYQILLDKDCEIANMTPNNEIYGASEYTVPTGATPMENFLVRGETASIDIPAGEYDFYVLNAVPSEGTVYLAGGEGVGDNFKFKGGIEYVFTVRNYFTMDSVKITSNSLVELGVSEIISPVTAKGLSAEESVTARIFNNGLREASSFTATYTLDGGQPVTETVNIPIDAGKSIDYTFTTKADFSAGGIHNLTVSVDNEEDGLPGNNSMSANILHIAPTPSPFVCGFDKESCLLEWNIIDANNDNKTWAILPKKQMAEIEYSPVNDLDDYLVTTCPVSLPAGTNNIAIEYNGRGDYGETFEILYGKTENVDEMTVLKTVGEFSYMKDGLIEAVNFEAEEAGDYYFAIHAISEADRIGMQIWNVAISEGAFLGEPDLTVSKVILPLSNCSLGNEEKASAIIFNNGSVAAKGFTLEYSVNGETKGTQTFDVKVPFKRSVEVKIDAGLDLSAVGKYTVGVKIIDVIPEDGQNPETITDNNYGEAPITHFTPTDVPFIVDFTDESQRDNWVSDDSWSYDESYFYAVFCKGTTPLVSRGINLEADKTYRMSYSYLGGKTTMFFVSPDAYDIIIGKDGAPLNEWKTVKSFEDIYTSYTFINNEITFTVPEDGVYSLGFKQDAPQASFMLKNVSITEIAPYDARITGFSGMPSMLPKSQAGNHTANVAVNNRGTEAITGTVSVTINGKEAGSAKFERISANKTSIVSVPVTIDNITTDNATIEAKATIDGHDDPYVDDNVKSASMTITEDVYAYDYMTDDMYNEYSTIGIDYESPCTAGTIFHINNETTLNGMSIGWGITTGEQVSIAAYKWDKDARPDINGYVPVGEKVISTTADQGTTAGQIEYMFDKPATLTPGDYILAVSYTGFALATDGNAYGQLYLISDNAGTICAKDQSISGFGTPAIRMITGKTTGIGTVETGTNAQTLVYDAASKTIVATSSTSAIENIAVYSASGTQVGNKAANANVCRYDASRLTPGIYVVRMKTADGTVTSKIAVK